MKMKRKYATAPVRRADVYNEWKAVFINFENPLSSDIAIRADRTFARLRPHLKNSKLREKQQDWRAIYAALERAAAQKRACVVFHRNRNHPDYRSTRIELMNAAVIEKIVEPILSKKGSPKASRYIPVGIEAPKVFVELRDRDTKEPLAINWRHPVPSGFQTKLELVNETNAAWEITIEPWDYWMNQFKQRRRIRPVHRAIFTESFDLHGRMYGRHQEFGKASRKTIRFGNSLSVELDYEGFHPRMLYHREGIRYGADPYLLWGDGTTPPMRLMAKKLINIAINAESRAATIDACNNAMSRRTKQDWKQGKELEEAQMLYIAAQKTELKFSDIYELAVSRHQKIRKYFGSDQGMKLMRTDSEIAVEIMFHFASRGYPCLSVHDSFIVPADQEDELRRVMILFYRRKLGFEPVVKK